MTGIKCRLQGSTICSYTVCGTQYDRLSQQQLSFLIYSSLCCTDKDIKITHI